VSVTEEPGPPEDALAEPSLRRQIVAGVAWKGTSQVILQVTRLVVAVVLARLLAPNDYGLAAMVLVFSSFILIFADLALGQVIVQRRSLDEADRTTAFWTAVGAGVLFTLAGVAVSPLVADFFGEPEVASMVAVVSLSFAIRGLTMIQSALLVRGMQFRALELREIAATMTGAAVALGVAAAGYGAWAIVWQQLVSASVGATLIWTFSQWRPSLSFSAASLRSFAGFSGNVLAMNVVRQLRGTTDNALIGRFLGAPPLGAYALAYNVVLVPFNRLAIPLSQVLFPALSRIQDDPERMSRYWIRSVRLVAALALPALTGLAISAQEFVDIVLGDPWDDAVPVVQLLAIVGILQTLQFLNSAILQALDRTTTLLRWTLVSFVLSVAAFVVGLRWGIVGVAAAYAVVAAITEPLYARATARALGASLSELLRPLGGVAAATGTMAAALVLARQALEAGGAGSGTTLALLVGIGVASYAALVPLLARPVVDDVRQALRRTEAPAVSPR